MRLHNLGHETVDIEAVSYSIQMAIRQEGVQCLTPKSKFFLSRKRQYTLWFLSSIPKDQTQDWRACQEQERN